MRGKPLPQQDTELPDAPVEQGDVATAVRPKECVAEGEEPPDGGFGWVVVMGSFFVHFFVLGSIYSFGVFFPVYIDRFNSSAGEKMHIFFFSTLLQ